VSDIADFMEMEDEVREKVLKSNSVNDKQLQEIA
jgi:hypothetical protein